MGELDPTPGYSGGAGVIGFRGLFMWSFKYGK